MTPIVTMKPGTPKRAKKTIDITVEEKPKRVTHVLGNHRARDKYIKQIESLIRKSTEYRELVEFIKKKMNRSACYVNPAISNTNGKKYSIELHHEPLTLYDLVDIELVRREMEMCTLDKWEVAETVMELHYMGLVGLFPLSKTQHELIHNGKVFIPLQHVYEDFYGYYTKYAEVIESEYCKHIKEKIDAKVQLSLRCADIQSDVENPEFVYMNVDGFELPQIPDEWSKAVLNSTENLAKEELAAEKAAKEEQKKSKK